MKGNAWRTSHNNVDISLLDACDELGYMVWDENHYNLASDPAVRKDVKAMVKRDRNHPSVIMWSICNEVLCEGFNATSAQILKDIITSFD